MNGAFVFSFADSSITIEILRLNIRKISEYIILIKYESYWVLHPDSRSKLTYAQFDPMQYQMSYSEEIKYFLLLCLILPQLYHIISSILSLIKEVLLLINLFKCLVLRIKYIILLTSKEISIFFCFITY